MKKILLLALLLLLNSQFAFAKNWCDEASMYYCYPVDEGSGTTVYDDANSYDLTITGTVTWQTASPSASYSSNYLNFDGSNDYARDTAIAPWIGNYAIGMWVNPYYTDADNIFFNHYGSGGNRTWLGQNNGGDGKFYFEYMEGGHWNGVYGTSTPTGDWQHIVGTRTDYTSLTNDLRVYVDGVLEKTSDSDHEYGISLTNGILTFGTDQAGGYDYKGDGDEMFMYRNTMDSTDINDIMDNGLLQASSSSYQRGVMIFN